MAENKQTLDELLEGKSAPETEKFLIRIAALALKDAGIYDPDQKTDVKYKIPKNDDEKKLAEDWQKKLFVVAKNNANDDKVTDKELEEFKKTIQKWGNDLGKKVIEDTVDVLKKRKQENKVSADEIKKAIYGVLTKILKDWDVNNQWQIYNWVTGYKKNITAIAKKMDYLKFYKDAKNN